MYSDQQANAGLFAPGDGVDIHEQSPLNLAFVGDGVWELLVRQRLVERTRLTPGKLHAVCVKYVSAKGQSKALEVIEPLGGEGSVDGAGPVANIYDIEPCLYNLPLETLTKRNRYYRGRIDGQYLKSGERDYSRLPNLYVITILPYDPFGQDFIQNSRIGVFSGHKQFPVFLLALAQGQGVFFNGVIEHCNPSFLQEQM